VDKAVYAVEAQVEETHWWFVGRRRLISRLLEELGVSRDARVIDVGSGTGTNLRMLREIGFRDVTGLDASPVAIQFCHEKKLGPVEQGDVCQLPFESERFELVLATDIIEHVDRDDLAVAEIHRVLRPGGMAIITVPAFASLFGLQDEVSQHKRRYRMEGLRSVIEKAGLRVERSFHFNYLLFAPIWLARQVIRVLRISLSSENQVNSPVLNWVLERLFRLDVRTAPTLRPPFGVSILAVARRPAGRPTVAPSPATSGS
jgi:SAM-dependent methyltransferase